MSFSHWVVNPAEISIRLDFHVTAALIKLFLQGEQKLNSVCVVKMVTMGEHRLTCGISVHPVLLDRVASCPDPVLQGKEKAMQSHVPEKS